MSDNLFAVSVALFAGAAVLFVATVVINRWHDGVVRRLNAEYEQRTQKRNDEHKQWVREHNAGHEQKIREIEAEYEQRVRGIYRGSPK
jgi:hypothetical protein